MGITNREGCIAFNKNFELYYPTSKLDYFSGNFVLRLTLISDIFICTVAQYSIFRVQILGFGFAISIGDLNDVVKRN